MIALRDLRRLRRHLLAALAMVAAGTFVSWQVDRGHDTAEQQHREAEARVLAVTQRYRDALRNENDMRAILARYEALAGSGALGSERRLDWIEFLRQTRDSLRLPALEYEIRPQRTLRPDDEGFPRLVASSMSLALRLRHEGELVALFDALAKAPSAIVVPRGCTIDRLPPGDDGRDANLRVGCEIDWVTVLPAASATAPEGT